MLSTFLSARNHLATQILFTLFCSSIAFLLVGYPLIMTGSLYHDHYTIYSFFRNSFLSVLHFGEIRWWDPTVQYGFPSYYFSFLGLYAATPLFWLAEGCMFALHLLGIRDISIHTVVIVYISFLIPLLFNLSFLSLTRQIFKSNTTIALTVMMAAFSPGLLFSVSDVTFEFTAYGMFVAAAMLALVRSTTRTNYLLLNLALCILLLSFNHPALYWNPLFLTVFGVSLLLFPERKIRDVFSEFRNFPLWQHLFFGVSILLCLLPTTLCYLAGTEIFRSTIGKRLFDPLEIYGGNPLEFIMAGIPSVGIARTAELLSGFPVLIPANNYVEYGYLGILSIPLLLLGLMYGQKTWRCRLYLLLSFFAVAILLGGNSAFLSILYLVDSPFRAVRHFGDTTLRNGLFALMILAAGLGFEALLSVRSKRIRNVFLGTGVFWLFAICSIASAMLFLSHYAKVSIDVTSIGYMIILCVFYLPVLFLLHQKPGVTKSLRILVCLIVFLDLSCSTYLFVRHQILPQAVRLEDDNNPLSVTDANLYFQENTILTLKDISALKERTGALPDIPYLGLAGKGGVAALGMEHVSAMSYNRIEINVSPGEASTLFWRDSWFRGWEATVNGEHVPIEKYMGAFKAVPVAVGGNVVTFEFFPRSFARSLIVGWLVVSLILAALFGSCIKRIAQVNFRKNNS